MGWGKVECWRSDNISEMCKSRGKVTMEGFTNALSNGTSPTPGGLLFPKIAGSQPPKLQSLLSQKRVKLRTLYLAGRPTFTGSIRTKAIQNFGEKGAWAYPGTIQIFGVYPIISGRGKATNFKFCTQIHRSIGTKAR